MIPYEELGFIDNMTKLDAFQQLNIIDSDTQIEDESINGMKLTKKSVSLDRLYGTDLEVGGSSNISGRLLVLDTSGTSRITIDGSTGLNITDNAGSSVLQAVISGATVGDVVLGNYGGSSGLFYDKSTGSFTVKGIVNLGVGSTLSADYITTGTLNADRIGATSITANKLNVSTLSSITANVGTLTAGTISGVTLQSSSGDTRIIIDSGDYIYFYVGGTEKAKIRGVTATRATGIVLNGDYVTENNKSFLIKSSAGGASEYGGIGITSGNQFWLTLGTDNTFYIKNNAQDENYFTVSSTKTYSEHEMWLNSNLKFGDGSSLAEHDIEGINTIKGYNDINLQPTATGTDEKVYFKNHSGTTEMTVKCDDGGKIVCVKDQIELGGHTLTLTGDVSLP